LSNGETKRWAGFRPMGAAAMLPGRSVDRMDVSPVFNLVKASAPTGLLKVFDGPFAKPVLRGSLSIQSLIKCEDRWI
jgi:hypothetical protein